MMLKLALIGFGEAGSSFALAAGWRARATVFDIRPVDYAAAGVSRATSLAEAVAECPVILSVVTADAALEVALAVARHSAPKALYFDMNSVSPGCKREAAAALAEAGGRYVDTAVMAPVNPHPLAVPLLLSGPDAAHGKEVLVALGFTNVRVVGDDVGRASTIKMLRSVMYKGVEALTAECLLASARAGVTEEVLASFGNDWSTGADYRLDRMLVHGERRAAEMEESVKTLSELGIDPLMTRGVVEWQRQFGALQIKTPPNGLEAKLERLSTP